MVRVDLGMKMLFHDRTRLAMTVLGVAFSVALVLVQVGLFLGLIDNATIAIEKLPADIWIAARNTPNIDFGSAFSDTLVYRVRSVPGVERADNLIAFYSTFRPPSGGAEMVFVYAMDDFEAWNFPWKLEGGSVAALRQGPHMMIDESARRRLGDFQIGDYRELGGRRLRIVGITKEALSFTTTPVTFLDLRLFQETQPDTLSGRTIFIVARCAPNVDPETVRREIQARLPYHDVWLRQEWINRTRRYWIITTGLGMNMGLTALLGCLVGVLVVAQTLYTFTMEHLREFGTIKAIGGSNVDIFRIQIRQALVCGVIGFALGIVPPLILGPVVASFGFKLILPGTFIFSVFLGTLVLCVGSASFSFRRVAGIDPALVFRT